jgi:hypothetical protein
MISTSGQGGVGADGTGSADAAGVNTIDAETAKTPARQAIRDNRTFRHHLKNPIA